MKQATHNLNKGLQLIKGDTIQVNNSIFSDNSNHGMLMDSTTQVKLQGNSITNNPIGIAAKDAQRVTIGGLLNGQQNELTANTISGISLEGTTQTTKISQNRWSCNEAGIALDSTANKGIITPIINPIVDVYALSGTSEEGSIIALYKSSSCSTTCEGETFIIEVVSNGAWIYILDEPLEDGDKITAISTKDGVSSAFADCVVVDCTATNNAACMSTATTDISTTNLFEVFPNPVAETLIINKLSTKNIVAQVALFNAQGILLSQFSLPTQKNTIPMGDYPSGVYFLRIDTVEGQFKQKVIKL